MAKKKTRNILVAIGLTLLISFAAIFTWLHFEAKSIYESMTGIDNLGEIEENYKREPNLRDCFTLADRYGYVLKDYSKGIEYAEQCLKLDEKPNEHLNFRIHFWLAHFYNKVGDNEKSKEYLTVALQIDSKDIIEEHNWIEDHELQLVFNSIQGKP